ncbi:U-box domain-containing protein 54 [Hondaea fermentalgiana]|uniref:U-box domain-containing protein 54 n=1 Tax=Hondaea fermentalgiana TaxID=2315210 RepID=A0A2R5GFH4_9STRA|nr:U-box domain-containing protein 54 [Hondaea fermentalgiana]|eukprot:GBG29315.1 U-box domain-containing protein 54 [Hondaea fermentalgiana]
MSDKDNELNNWTCPILQTIMRDPVVAADGHTYERAAMEEWFRSCNDAQVTSPMTGFPLPSRILFANHNLRKSIADYIARNPDAEKDMTTKEEIAALVERFRSGGEARPDSPPLIDLRSDAEIAAANAAAAKEASAASTPVDTSNGVQVHMVRPPQTSGAYAASASAAPPTAAAVATQGITCVSSWAHSVSIDEPASRPILVSGSRDRSVRIWRAATAAPSAGGSWNFDLAANLEKHTDFVTCCEIEVGSGTLVTGGGDWKTCLWDLHRLDAGCISEFEAHSYAVRCCAWSTSGQYAVNGYEHGHRVGASGLAAAAGACFASGGDDEMVYVTDPRASGNGRVAQLSTGAAVLSMCWGPTDDAPGALPWLAAGGGVPLDSFNASSDNIGGWVRVWDPRMWKPVGDCCSFGATPIQDPSGAVYDAAASSRTLQVHRASSSEWESDKSREAHSTMVSGLSPVRVADGTIALASVGDDHFLRLWKLPRGVGDSMLKPALLQAIRTNSSPCYVGLLA